MDTIALQPIELETWRELVQKACQYADLTDPPHPDPRNTNDDGQLMLVSDLGDWRYSFCQTPWRETPDGRWIMYLLLIVHQPGKLEGAQYFYYGIGGSDVLELETAARKLAEFVKDSQLPEAERKYRYAAENQSGPWSGIVQEICWKGGGS